MIDCDVHCAPLSLRDLEPYLGEYWREYVDGAGIRVTGFTAAYRPAAPTSARPGARDDGGPAVPNRYELLRGRLFDSAGAPSRVILNCLTGWEAHRNPYYQAAFASALNDWLRHEWLDRDERLRASIVVPTVDPDDAVAEIERLSDDTRFVQVLWPARADAPLGNKRYHRLLAACAERRLVVGIHAWGRTGRAPTPSGFTLSYLEDYLSNPIVVQSHVLSLVGEGAFERFPSLRVALVECGFSWLPPLLWRFDKDWKGVWREVPWVKELPSTYVRRHFRATIEPAHLPAAAGQVAELVEMVGSGWLLYASDHPHDHGPGAERLFEVLDEAAAAAVRAGNAEALYPLLSK